MFKSILEVSTAFETDEIEDVQMYIRIPFVINKHFDILKIQQYKVTGTIA